MRERSKSASVATSAARASEASGPSRSDRPRRAHRDDALAALEAGRLRRVVIVVTCTDDDSARRTHAPTQEGPRVRVGTAESPTGGRRRPCSLASAIANVASRTTPRTSGGNAVDVLHGCNMAGPHCPNGDERPDVIARRTLAALGGVRRMQPWSEGTWQVQSSLVMLVC